MTGLSQAFDNFMHYRRYHFTFFVGKVILGLMLLLATAAQTALATTLCLNSGWSLARVPDVAQAGNQISLTNFNAASWIPAVVPGTALTSYQNAGMIGDPYFGTNMAVLDFTGYYDTFYWYRNLFYVPADFSGQKLWLNFDGINWKADIYVNGSYAGRIDGPFKHGKFDVSSLITPGTTNCVAVMLYWSNATVYDAPTFVCADSWDFMPPIAGRDVGLYQDVYLTATGPVSILNPFVASALPLPSVSPASLTVQVGLTNATGNQASGILIGTILPEGITFQTNVTVGASSLTNFTLSPAALAQLSITNPALWWPNGYGPPNLHTLQLSFQTGSTTSDVQNISFGIRQYSYNTNGHDLQLSCNGQPILCKGGNWGIADAMLKYTPDQVDTALHLHQQMNFNLIRCWHGTSDLRSFYDACDKYGLMVWDEFWLNGSQVGLAPVNTAMFETNAVDKILRLRNHPCIAAWCGENEATPPPPLDTFLPQMINQLDGTRIYFQASNAGGIHGGGPYSFQGPEWYFQNASGFTTEIGLPSVPAVESMEAMMPAASLWPLGDTNWLWHNWAADIGNKGLPQYTNAVSSSYGPATGIADFCNKAQLLNLESYKAIFEAWNAHLFTGSANPPSGVLLWMSQAAWPSLIWQTYDWYFDLGGAYFGSKKGCEPLHVQWDCDDNSVRVINATAQNLPAAIAAIQVYNLNGALVFNTNVNISNLAASTATNCFTLFNNLNGLSSVHFIKLKLSDPAGNLLSDNFYWRGTTYQNYTALNSLSTVSPGYSASYATTNGTTTIMATFTNAGPEVAFAARLKLLNATSGQRVLPAFYSDNYFSLVPGDSRTISIQFTNSPVASGPLQLVLTGWNIPTQQVLTLTVSPAVPVVAPPVVLPASMVNQGATITLACTNFSGTTPYGFQWQACGDGANYTNLTGATSNILVLPAVTVKNTGYYKLIFTAGGQSVTSSVAPLTVQGSPHGARLSIKFAADKGYGYDAINNGPGTGALNSTYWFNFYGPNGGSSGVTNVTFYTTNDVPVPSRTVLVYNWAGELNYDNEQATLPNNLGLMDSFIFVNNNSWYLSATNLDAAFTNGYSLYAYYYGGVVGRGGQNYVRYYAGQTTNTAVLGTKQWNLYTTTTNNDGHFTQDLTPANTGAAGETAGANYFVFTNLSGGAFDLLITNGNFGGINGLEIVANPLPTTSSLSVSTNTAPFGTALVFSNTVYPPPSDGEPVVFLDGATVLATAPLHGSTAVFTSGTLGTGPHSITAVYGGDSDYLASTSSVLSVNIQVAATLSPITVLPSASVYSGTNVTLVCSNFSGAPPLQFRWQASGSNGVFHTIAGAITNSLALTNVTTSNSGFYQLIFTANSQSVFSALADLTVTPRPTLGIQTVAAGTVLSWTQGLLLEATNLNGPWMTDNAASPYTVRFVHPQTFYRVLGQ